jgi:hypothetical protein
MSRPVTLAVAAALALGSSAAYAQYGYPLSYAAHGYADIVRSAGVYNLTTSEAYKNLEDARKKNIDNRLLWTKTYFEMRRVNDEYRRAQYERDKRTQEDFIRYAQAAAPRRLTSSQLDPITGYLKWPRLLLTADFADLRRDLDKLFSERATTKGAIGNDAYFLIIERVDEMKERLRKLIKVVPTADYIDASRFLDSLGHEARFAAG